MANNFSSYTTSVDDHFQLFLLGRVPKTFDASLDASWRGNGDPGETHKGDHSKSCVEDAGGSKKSFRYLRDVIRRHVVETNPTVSCNGPRDADTKYLVDDSISVAVGHQKVDGGQP